MPQDLHRAFDYTVPEGELSIERIKQLYTQGGMGTFAGIVTTFFICALLWDSSPKVALTIWAFFRIAIFFALALLIKAFQNASANDKSDPKWGNRFHGLAILSGISWGSSSIIICQTTSPLDQAVLVTFVFAAVTGAMALYAPMRSVYTGFIIASMVPIGACFASKGDVTYLTLAALVLIYLLAISTAAKRLEGFYLDSLRLRYENQGLVDYLEQQRHEAESLNKELQREIDERSKIEVELRQARDELEARVSERTAELMEINEELGWEIIERKGIEEKLIESAIKYKTLVENVNSLIIRINTKGQLTFLNEYAARFFGYTLDEALGRNIMDLIVPETDSHGRDMASLMCKILTEPELHETVEIENIRKDGERAWISWTNKGLRNGMGGITEVQCVGNDITLLKQAEEALRTSEKSFKELYDQSERAARLHKALLDHSPDPIAVYDINGKATYVNPAFNRIFGWSLEEVASGKIQFCHQGEGNRTDQMVSRALNGENFSGVRAKRLAKSSRIIDVSISGAPYVDDHGKPAGCIIHLRNISDKIRAQDALKKAHDQLDHRVKERTAELAEANARLQEEIKERQRIEEALRYQATHDDLTQVWNRKTIIEALARELSRCQREGVDAGVIMVDLDHFKQVNDSAGHLVGDEVLKEVAVKINSQLREYDWLGRYGGEEFLIILPGAEKSEAIKASERIRRAVADAPLQTQSGSVSVTVSLGVTTIKEMESPRVDSAIRNADTALYLAKENGRNRVEFHDSNSALQ